MWSPRTSPNGRYIAALSEQDSKMMLFDTRTRNGSNSPPLFRISELVTRRQVPLFQEWNQGKRISSRVVRTRVSDFRLETVLDLKSLDRRPSGHSELERVGLDDFGSAFPQQQYPGNLCCKVVGVRGTSGSHCYCALKAFVSGPEAPLFALFSS